MMPSLLSVILLALTTQALPTYRTCHNVRVGSRINYPADLSLEPKAGNGNDCRFVPADGQT